MHTSVTKFLPTLAILTVAAFSLSAPAFAWTCGSNRICVESKSRGNFLLVKYRAEAPVTHVNVIQVTPASKQFEASGAAGSFTLPLGFVSKVRYKMQRCIRGGVGQRSACSSWTTFSRQID
jgi:hypothetical protein